MNSGLYHRAKIEIVQPVWITLTSPHNRVVLGSIKKIVAITIVIHSRQLS